MMCDSRKSVETQEEQVLYDDRCVGEKCGRDGRRSFDACPSQVDVEEKEEDA